MQERDPEMQAVRREKADGQREPELSIKPLVDLLSRLVQEPPWLPSTGDAVADAQSIDDWLCERSGEVITWIQTVEKCSQAVQALIRFKVENPPRGAEDGSSGL